MEKYSIREVIEQAVQTEKLGFDFYASMAKRFSKNTALKKLFDTLAVKERQHEKRFFVLKKRIKDEDSEGWEDVSAYLRAIVESEFFLGNNKSLAALKKIKTIKAAVNYALGFEKETLLYYLSMKDMIKEKEIMEKIINEEKRHIIWLSNIGKDI
ncbi:MAG: ferritin family protein [Nitrospirae bacterium]|nr:ferritin family protein [Nitrospirota bacterium]